MLAIFLVAGTIFSAVPSAKSTNCFECSEVPHPQDCLTITTCAGNDKCFIEQYVTSGGLVLYNSGCLSPDRCTLSGKRAAFNSMMLKRRSKVKRQPQISSTDIPTCVSCCEGEYCNVDGCGTTAIARQDRGPRCFECTAQEDTESCRDVKACDRHQVCALYKPLHQIHENEWSTGCMSEKQCNAIVHVESGKRAVQEVNRCPRCCTDDLCNYSCRQNLTVTAPTTTVAVPTHQHLAITHATAAPVQASTQQPASTTPLPTVNQHSHNTHQQPASTEPTTLHQNSHSTHQHTASTEKPTQPTTHQAPASTTPATTLAQHSHNTHHDTVSTQPPTQPATHQAPVSTTPAATLAQHSHNTHHDTASTQPPTQPATHQAPVSTTPAVTLAQHSHNTHHEAPTTVATNPVTTKGTVITKEPTSPSPTTDPAVGCKIDGYIYDAPTRLCLKFFEIPKLNWTEAQQFCNQSKGQLAIITGDQKIKDVLQFYKDDGYTSKMWVGATDLGNGHIFHFTDGSTITLDPAQGQDLSNANCLYMTPGSYKLYDPCREKNGFICERSSTIRG